MQKTFCDKCEKEISEKEIKIFQRTWGTWAQSELCQKCYDFYESKKEELKDKSMKIMDDARKKILKSEKEIVGDLK